METRTRFEKLIRLRGSDVLYHKDDSEIACPCRSVEGFRDPIWHSEHPLSPVCNAAGYLPSGTVEILVKGFMQPIQSTRATRLQSEILEAMFGNIQADDHLGIFPLSWNGAVLDFENWGQATEDWLEYDGRKYHVINSNKIPDPANGKPHHFEIGARLIR